MYYPTANTASTLLLTILRLRLFRPRVDYLGRGRASLKGAAPTGDAEIVSNIAAADARCGIRIIVLPCSGAMPSICAKRISNACAAAYGKTLLVSSRRNIENSIDLDCDVSGDVHAGVRTHELCHIRIDNFLRATARQNIDMIGFDAIILELTALGEFTRALLAQVPEFSVVIGVQSAVSTQSQLRRIVSVVAALSPKLVGLVFEDNFG